MMASLKATVKSLKKEGCFKASEEGTLNGTLQANLSQIEAGDLSEFISTNENSIEDDEMSMEYFYSLFGSLMKTPMAKIL